MTSYSQAGGKTAVSFAVSKYTPSLIYYAPNKVNINSTKNFDFNEWIYVRTIIDLENQKATMFCGETLENLQPWAGLGTDSTYEFINNVDGISSIYFRGKGSLAMDDLHIYTVEEDDGPELSDIIVEDNILKSVALNNITTLPDTVSVIAALYNNENVLIAAELLSDIKLDKSNNNQIIMFNDKIIYEDGYKIKIFVWDSLTSVRPLTLHMVYPQ